jgi:hypothetical protein
MTIYQVKAGTADVSVILRALDSTTGAPVTFAYDNAGIDMWYRREAATKTSITEVTRATADAAHADGGIIIIGDGYFRMDLPDAACVAATGIRGVLVGGSATGVVIVGAYINLVAYDPTDTIRLGLTALPNAAADAAGGLPISDAGGLDLDANVANGLIAYDLDHLVKTSISTGKPTVGSLIDKILNKSASQTFDPTTDSMEAVVDNTATAAQLAAATAAQTDIAALIAAWVNGGRLDLLLDAAAAGGDLGGVWDIERDEHDTAGTFGEVSTLAQLVAAILLTPANKLATDGSGQVSVGAIANSAITAVSIAADAITNAKIADDAIAAENIASAAITSAKVHANYLTAVATALLEEQYIAHCAAGNVSQLLDDMWDGMVAAGSTLITMMGIMKNTALAKFSFIMRSSTTHLPLAGLTVTCTRSINGGAFGAGTLANVAGLANGVYLVDFGAGDLNGKVITLRGTATGADDTFVTIVTSG